MESRTHEVDWNTHGSERQEIVPNHADLLPNGSAQGLGTGSNFDDAGDEDSELESNYTPNDLSIEALQLALQQMTVPPCPPDLQTVLDATSLERLVYWKLQTLFDRFDEAPPNNVLRVVQEHVERPLFSLVLKKTKGNQSRAAHVLGCNRNTLHRKLKNLAIQPGDVRRAIKMQSKRTFRNKIEAMLEGH
jgi:DNA-binding protein Fis